MFMIGDKISYTGHNEKMRARVGGAMGEIYSKVLNEDSFVCAYGKASYILMASDLERFRGQVKSPNEARQPDKKEKKDRNGPQVSRRRGKPEEEAEETE
jgi:hypothetical protein